MTQLKSKYTMLWKAKEGLKVKTLNVTFNYKDSTGSDATLVFPVTYGEKLSDAQKSTQRLFLMLTARITLTNL